MARHEQGVCPICGSTNISYGDVKSDSIGVHYKGTCDDCTSTFNETYYVDFTGHYDIKDNKVSKTLGGNNIG